MSRYFRNYEDKYNPLLSFKNPVVIKARVNIDKNDIKFNVGSITEIDSIVRKVASDLSNKYNCIAFSSFNEINLIIEDPSSLSNNNKLDTHQIVSLFSQEIFMLYNRFTHNQKTKFVSVNTFNIFKDRVNSYLYSRQSICFSNYVCLLSSKLFPKSQIINKSNEEMLAVLEDIKPSLKSIKNYIKSGFVSVNGIETNLLNINKLKSVNNKKNINKKQKDVLIYDDSVIEEDI